MLQGSYHTENTVLFWFDLSWSIQGSTLSEYMFRPAFEPPITNQVILGTIWETDWILTDSETRWCFTVLWERKFKLVGSGNSSFGSKFFTLSGAFCYRRMNSSWLKSKDCQERPPKKLTDVSKSLGIPEVPGESQKLFRTYLIRCMLLLIFDTNILRLQRGWSFFRGLTLVEKKAAYTSNLDPVVWSSKDL